MDRPDPDPDGEWLVPEGEEPGFPEPGVDADFDAWIEQELLATIAEVDAGTMPLIDNDEVKRQSKALIAELLRKADLAKAV